MTTIFEYAEDEPTSFGDGQAIPMQCRQKSRCPFNVSERLAVAWNHGGPQISVTGFQGRAEIANLVAWLE